MTGAAAIPAAHAVPAGEANRVWLKIGLLSFGGPAGQIALMHRILVEEKRWIDEARFLHALNYCMLLPGPEAQQLATFVGWMLHGIRGGIIAGTLFILPGALVMLALSAAYALWGTVPVVAAAFLGIKAAVLAIVIDAVLRPRPGHPGQAGPGRRGLRGAVLLRDPVPAGGRGGGAGRRADPPARTAGARRHRP
jgi:chromate transporter